MIYSSRSMAVLSLLVLGSLSDIAAQEYTAALVDSAADGRQVTITASLSASFGSIGPNIFYYNDFSTIDVSGGAASIPTGDAGSAANPLGIANITSGGIVEAAADLPYGRGVIVGTPIDITRVVCAAPEDASNENFTWYYIQWPDGHQDNAESHIGDGWQVKTMWRMFGNSGYAHPAAYPCPYDTAPHGTTGATPRYWYHIRITHQAGGGAGAWLNVPYMTGMIDPGDNTRWKTQPTLRMLWIKAGEDPTSTDGTDGYWRLVDTLNGVVQEIDFYENGWWGATTNTDNVMDRITIPGYVNGFPQEHSAHLYFSHIYITWGPGAPARVEITDHPVYSQSRLHTICTVDAWGDLEITATLRSGIFGSSLSSGFVHVFDANNNHAGDGVGVPLSEGAGWPAPTPGSISGGVITTLSYSAQSGAAYYLVRVIETGEAVPRTVGHFTGLLATDINTGTATGTVYVTAHAANDSLLATSQAAAYGGAPD